MHTEACLLAAGTCCARRSPSCSIQYQFSTNSCEGGGGQSLPRHWLGRPLKGLNSSLCSEQAVLAAVYCVGWRCFAVKLQGCTMPMYRYPSEGGWHLAGRSSLQLLQVEVGLPMRLRVLMPGTASELPSVDGACL